MNILCRLNIHADLVVMTGMFGTIRRCYACGMNVPIVTKENTE